ncbi:hypothetical protein CDAR_502441 [Caerostris darwini]|uniref:Uncharacterized protein n=1 Tax=Caerostris darwini TaxID=1538125 RepID=A0AAV4Q738_9ARAC|nr:hypothetical protein CDAR_502441 [Caerostris darwini]
MRYLHREIERWGEPFNGPMGNAFDDIPRNPVSRRHLSGALFLHSRKCRGNKSPQTVSSINPLKQGSSQHRRLFSASTRRSLVAIRATRDGSHFYSCGVQ